MTNGKRELALTLDEIRQRIVHARDGELWLGLSRDEAEELLAEIDRLTEHCGNLETSLAKTTGERDDALTTIRALVDHPEPSGT